MSINDFAIFGMRLRADRALPFLSDWDGSPTQPVAIEVTSGAVPPFLSGLTASNALFDFNEDGRIIVHPDGGPRILLDGGCRMHVDTCGVSEAHLHTWLFGSGIGTLLHQRGQPPLHSAVLNIAGRGVALAGDSGAGKSTTARALLARGHRLLSDDLGVIDLTNFNAHAGFPSIKLFAKSAHLWGDPIHSEMQVSADKEKFHISLSQGFTHQPVKLRLLVILKEDNDIKHPVISHVSRAQAIPLIHRFVYRRQAGMVLDNGQGVFAFAARLAAAIPVVSIRRPPDFAKLDALCALIEEAVAPSELAL